MKAIIIDSHKKVVYEEEFVKEGALKFMQNAVDGYIETAHEDAQGNTVYVNEEGLLHGEQDFFEYKGAHQPFAGRGVIVATDAEGETVGTNLTVEEVKAAVKFMSRDDVRAALA